MGFFQEVLVLSKIEYKIRDKNTLDYILPFVWFCCVFIYVLLDRWGEDMIESILVLYEAIQSGTILQLRCEWRLTPQFFSTAAKIAMSAA